MHITGSPGHLAEKLAEPHDADDLEGVETELASAFGGAVLLIVFVVIALMVVAYKAARSLL